MNADLFRYPREALYAVTGGSGAMTKRRWSSFVLAFELLQAVERGHFVGGIQLSRDLYNLLGGFAPLDSCGNYERAAHCAIRSFHAYAVFEYGELINQSTRNHQRAACIRFAKHSKYYLPLP